MKLLIVHDRQEVAEKIERYVSELELGEVSVAIAPDGATANRFLRDNWFDLLILDLTIPYLSGSMQPNIQVAEQLVRELFTLDSFNPPGDVIGLSRDPDAVDLITSNVGSHLMAMLREDPQGAWLAQLGDRIRYAAKSAEWRQFSAYRHHQIDALIVTALDEELEPYADDLEFEQSKRYSGANTFGFRDREGIVRAGVAFSIGRSGQPRAASRTQSLLSVFRPKLALMTGFCGGFEDKAKPGELLVFETVYDWDYGKWKGEGPDARFVSRSLPVSIDGTRAHNVAREFIASDFKDDAEVLGKIVKASGGLITSIELDRAQVASGSAVVGHESVISHIENINDTISAVDMESYGFYHACQYTHVIPPHALCLKAVADHANPDKGDEMHAACSILSAAAAVRILREWWDFEK